MVLESYFLQGNMQKETDKEMDRIYFFLVRFFVFITADSTRPHKDRDRDRLNKYELFYRP